MDPVNPSASEQDEQTPLILPTPHSRPPHFRTAPLTSLPTINVPKLRNGYTIVNLLCAIVFLAASSAPFANIPFTRLIEDAVCRQYYQHAASEPVDEEMCKEPQIQGQVAFTFGILRMLESIVSILAALPWGIAADRIGRKPVFALALLGMSFGFIWWLIVLSFQAVIPIWVGWLSSLSFLIGGGDSIVTAVLLSMVTDVAPEGSRAILFMRTHVAALVGLLVSPALSSAMMNATGPRPVLCMAIILLLVAALAFLFIPETLRHSRTPASSETQSFKDHLSSALKQLKESLLMLNKPLILLFLALFLTAPAYYSMLQFMAQYISKRYALKLKDTGYVQTVYGCAQIVVAFLVIPLTSTLLTPKPKPGSTTPTPSQEQTRDLHLTLISFGILIPGFLFLGSAPKLPYFICALLVLALGSGHSSFARALMSVHVDVEHRSRLFTLVGMLETAGTMYAGPLLAGLFSVGMRKGGGWIGLPYLVLAGFAVVALVVLLFVRLPGAQDVSGENEERDREV